MDGAGCLSAPNSSLILFRLKGGETISPEDFSTAVSEKKTVTININVTLVNIEREIVGTSRVLKLKMHQLVLLDGLRFRKLKLFATKTCRRIQVMSLWGRRSLQHFQKNEHVPVTVAMDSRERQMVEF